jgi:hypothetical protein
MQPACKGKAAIILCLHSTTLMCNEGKFHLMLIIMMSLIIVCPLNILRMGVLVIWNDQTAFDK